MKRSTFLTSILAIVLAPFGVKGFGKKSKKAKKAIANVCAQCGHKLVGTGKMLLTNPPRMAYKCQNPNCVTKAPEGSFTMFDHGVQHVHNGDSKVKHYIWDENQRSYRRLAPPDFDTIDCSYEPIQFHN